MDVARPPPSKIPTDELPASDAYDIGQIKQRLLEVIKRLQFINNEINDITNIAGTLSKLAGKLDLLSKNLTPPELHEVLAKLDGPYTVSDVKFMAERLTEAIIIISELMADAEITGSNATYERAKRWLESLGILVS